MNRDCVSLEVAQKLQKAGYKCEIASLADGKYGRPMFLGKDDDLGRKTYWLCPTATQLADELPQNLTKDIYNVPVVISRRAKDKGSWQIKYGRTRVQGKTLPDALGLMMVYLLENKLINKPKENQP